MQIVIKFTGSAPLVLHSDRTANPIDPAAKAIKKLSSKRVKTDADHEEIARIEHAAGIYFDPDIGPYVPGANFFRCLTDAARITKAGKKIERGLLIVSNVNPLAYPGPRTLDGLWEDESYRLVAAVKIGKAKTMRCRPIFREWRTECQAMLDRSILGLDELGAIVEQAGSMVGLGDWRPLYGRFTGEVVRA